MLIPCLEESLAKFRLRLIHLALSAGMVFVPAQKLSGINSNVDIAKLTPSAGQVESDAVTVLWANASEFMFFGHSIPIYSHFKTNFTALKRLFHADAHANHVELFPAASRWMITCLAAVGCFHDLLIIIEESACGWFASTMSICSSSISVCRKERKPSLIYICLKKTAYLLHFPSKYDVCLGANANILSKRKVACNFFKRRRLRCETLETFAFVFILHFFTLL